MAKERDQVRFCVAPDGARLAYAVTGSGPPLVRAATWLSHLEHDRQSPVWRHWLEALEARRTLVRADERGCGLSDREVATPTLDTWVGDLEAVVDAAGLERFALLGVSQGAAIAAVYAARHPERVEHLVLYGGYARGRRFRGPGQRLEEEALLAAIRAGWNSPDATFRHLFSALFLPHGTEEQLAWYDELQRRSASADTAARLYHARGAIDVTEEVRAVTARTLAVHARGDRPVPLSEGRLLAALIPGARLTVVESPNHILLGDEPAWPAFLSALDDFLGSTPRESEPTQAALSAREREVLALVADGQTNEEIAARLVLSVRTVERHLTNTYAKLRVSGRAARAAAAARFAVEHRPPR